MVLHLRPFMAWSLAWLLLFAGWAVVFYGLEVDGPYPASRIFFGLVCAMLSVILALGGAALERDAGDDRSLQGALATWAVVLVLPVTTFVLFWGALLIAIALIVVSIVQRATGRVDGLAGLVTGILATVGAVVITLVLAWFMGPGVERMLGDALPTAYFTSSGYPSCAREGSVLVIAGALPAACSMALITVGPRWASSTWLALLRGMLVSAVPAILLMWSVFSCW